jgi:aminoglycoside phosphotransferase (APT) family kinase protein
LLEKQPVALLHGDLHLQNFFVENDQVALIDLDNLCKGSPWQEIGSFIAALHYRSLVAGTSVAEITNAIDHFCYRYANSVSWPASSAALAWYTAAALVNERAFRTISRLQSGGLFIIEAILERALSILER